MSLSAFAVGALACVVAFLALFPFIPEISAGVRAIVALRVLRSAVALFGHGFLGATRAIEWARAVIAVWRKSAAQPICAIALSAALATAAIVGTVSVAYAGPLAREPDDAVYLPPIAIRADGRLTLADGVTVAEAARVYAGPREYWASECPATLPGWRYAVDWQGVDAVYRPIWRATISGAGVVTVDGLSPAEGGPLRALLAELAPIVACGE